MWISKSIELKSYTADDIRVISSNLLRKCMSLKIHMFSLVNFLQTSRKDNYKFFISEKKQFKTPQV